MRINFSSFPTRFKRLGLIMPRGEEGEYDSSVTGDPCIVWDEEIGRYHMFYFAQSHTDAKEVNSNAHAIAEGKNMVGPNNWIKLGPLKYTNPQDLLGETHKPWILMDPYQPNRAVKINGKYYLFTVSFYNKSKIIQQADANSLFGPWTVQRTPVISLGKADDYDGYHCDTVTAYWFEKQDRILFFYKGYPLESQKEYINSPFGSCSCAAVKKMGDLTAKKIGRVIAPSSIDNHWCKGWVGGIQLIPAEKGWFGLISGSPTSPEPVSISPDMREPAPSLGGWAYTPEPWPICGWRISEQPLEWIENIPQDAKDKGEGVNLWRHHMLIVDKDNVYIYYNTGNYGQEQMFAKKMIT